MSELQFFQYEHQKNQKMQHLRDISLDQYKPKVRVYAIVNLNQGYEEFTNGVLQIVTDSYENHSEHYIEVKQFDSEQVLLRSRLMPKNNYEIQKNSVICWTDTQHQHQDLAISFQSQEQCDIYWRFICSKINKNYLEINGKEKLEMPNENNLNYILNKVRTSFKMIAYHILNDRIFIDSLKQVLIVMEFKNDYMGIGTIGRIVKAILMFYDSKVIQVFLQSHNFPFFLKLQTLQQNMNFIQLYSRYCSMQTLIELPEEIKEKVLVTYRASFWKEHILDFTKEAKIETLLEILIKDNYSEIIIYMINNNTLDKVAIFEQNPLKETTIQMNKNQSKSIKEKQIQHESTREQSIKEKVENEEKAEKLEKGEKVEKEEILKKQEKEKEELRDMNNSQIFKRYKLKFVMEALTIIKNLHMERTKRSFFNKFYESNILVLFQNLLEEGHHMCLDILNQLCLYDPEKFILFLRDQFRTSPTHNIHRLLAKKYASGQIQYQIGITHLLTHIVLKLKQRRDLLEFYSSTFLLYVFEHCHKCSGLIDVILLFLENIHNPTILYNLIVKNKIFDRINSNFQTLNKFELINFAKLIRLLIYQLNIFTETSPQPCKELNQVLDYSIRSGLFDSVLSLFHQFSHKNNLLASALIQTFQVISKSPYNIYIHYIQSKPQPEHPIITQIMHITPKQDNLPTTSEQANEHHLTILEGEQLQNYLQNDDVKEANYCQKIEGKISSENLKRRLELQQMANEMRKMSKQNQEAQENRSRNKREQKPKQESFFILNLEQQMEMQ